MFELYDEYIAVQYTSSGKRIAAYNTKLRMSRILRRGMESSAIQGKSVILLCPTNATWKRKQELSERAANEGIIVNDIVCEAEAVVRYECFQNKGIIENGVVLVIDIHKYSTDITTMQIHKNKIKPVFEQCVSIGGDTLTEKILRYYMEKLRRVKGDITGDIYSIHVLRDMVERAKLRMAKHRLKADEFVFQSPKDNIKYLMRIFREDYNRMVEEVMEMIFSADRKGTEKYGQCGYDSPKTVILAGGMNDYEYCIGAVKEKYVSSNVLSYKCSEAAILGAAALAAERGR